jgi:hypothetical protein
MYPGDSYNEAGSVLNLRYHSSTCGTFVQYEWLQDPEIDAAIERHWVHLMKKKGSIYIMRFRKN